MQVSLFSSDLPKRFYCIKISGLGKFYIFLTCFILYFQFGEGLVQHLQATRNCITYPADNFHLLFLSRTFFRLSLLTFLLLLSLLIIIFILLIHSLYTQRYTQLHTYKCMHPCVYTCVRMHTHMHTPVCMYVVMSN